MLYIVFFILFLTISGYLVENNYFKYIVSPYQLAVGPNKYIKQVQIDIDDATYPTTKLDLDKHTLWPNNNRYVYPFYSESYLKHPYYDHEFMEYSGIPKPYHLLDSSYL